MQKRFRILHVVLSIGETSAAYNEHCLPWTEKREISICTFFSATIKHPNSITLYEGNGTIRRFWEALHESTTAKSYDIIHVHAPHLGLLFLIAILTGFTRLSAATVFTVHDSYPNYKWRNRLLLLPVFVGFQKIVCCSHASYDSFPNLYKWLGGKRLCTVQNGLDIERVDRVTTMAGQNANQDSRFTVVAISRLVNIKNPFTLLSGFAQTADVNKRLIYIGDGVLHKALHAKSKEEKLEDSVEFTGLIARERVFEHLLNADLFVSASRGEGLPISVLEAMACSCPVLLSDIPPHREIAKHVDCIPLVKPDDAAGFGREIQRFSQMSREERLAIGKQCRKLVEERFSLRSMHRGYTEIYQQLSKSPLAANLVTE